MNKIEADVVVIGAGLAGLTAARELAGRGLSVCVLEARDRVGGRTLTEDIAGRRFDMGAQWLGPTQTRMAKLVAEFGLETFPTHHKGRKILEVGGKVSQYKGTIPSMAPHRLLMLNSVINKMEKLAKKVPADAPWDAPDAAERDAITVESLLRSRAPSKAVRGVIDAAVRVIFGADPSDISLLYFLFYLRSGGGLMRLVEIENGAQETRFVDGAQAVALRMSEGLGDAVVTGAPVRAIREDDGGVNVHGDDIEVRARFAVVAVPPPLAARITYEPSLPPERDSLMQRHPMGATTKSHVLYDEPFWRQDGLSGEAVCASGPFDVVFDNCSHDEGQPALLVFTCGSRAHALAKMGADERRRTIVEGLARTFGERAGHPVDYVEKDWAADEWTRGCPTGFMTPGALTAFGPALREPVGRIHWAGTESARQWAGYMEGAVESGDRAASEVLARI
jgi:monoamine oxidase